MRVGLTHALSLPTDRAALAAASGAPRPERLDDLCLAGLALARALDAASLAPRHALVLGTGLGCLESDAAFYRQVLEHGLARANPRVFAYTLPNVVLGEVAIAHGLTGEQLVINAGRASGLAALGEAAALIAEGAVDEVLLLVIDVVGPATLELFAAQTREGSTARPCVVGARLNADPARHLAWLDVARSSFGRPGPTPRPDPLGALGVPELWAALPNLDAPHRAVARCASGHCATVTVRPPQPELMSLGAGRFQVAFPTGWPVFRGHFPGAPVVPGAELIRLAAQAAGHPLRSVVRFSFLQPVRPGQVAVVELEGAGAVLGVRVLVDGALVARGQLEVAR